MNKNTNSHEHLQNLLDEHEQILSHMKTLNDWWTELDERGLPKFGEMGTRVQKFRDLLAKHFEDEEQEGYFKPVLDESPGFCIMVPDFKEKHSTILTQIDDFISRLKQPEPPFENWSAALQEFETLLADLREHENKEIKMVQEAFDKSAAN
ncbi:hemerythrin domain-containing protein [uncultured Gimesia sp.]|uniref:hemerythrin domain-containing protein n=1 Tax=uncultured Gimesia sp. TaxID=1678688 RepID=UPI0030D9D8DA|tara:strand:- start:106545 stop:106997 length:453 start_codon:yes stop_codon:yes gene_type:complete